VPDTYERHSVFQFGYLRSEDQDTAKPVRQPVVIVGAGPIGLATAIDLASRGVPVVLLDDANRIGEGSRGLCYSKRALEILDRLGVAAPVIDKGVTWQIGKVFFRDDMVYQFDLLPEGGFKMPAFVNLQQYYLEKFLVDRAHQLEGVDLRWSNRVAAVEQLEDGVRLTVETPDGPYVIEADYVVAADGARSTVRGLLGLDFVGQTFHDRFLIADVRMHADYPAERWFWFEPPFHGGQSTLLHKQADDIWRIDFQIGWDADPEEETKPENVHRRLSRMLEGRDYTLEWVSVYTFQCRRLEKFVHGRVIFAGDAAHQVSPFGARGANSGFEDAENIGWKLPLILRGEASAALLDSYDIERTHAADYNIGHSTRSTDFITPKNNASRDFRNAALELARRAPFARRMVNSGRLSDPSVYETPLSTPDAASFGGSAKLGFPVPDAPMSTADGADKWLLNALGHDFTLLVMKDGERPAGLPRDVSVVVIGEDILDKDGLFAKRYDATPGACYLVRPDQHLAARFRHFDADKIDAALSRAKGGRS